MGRINITETDEYTGKSSLIGWFDYDRTEKFAEDTEWDGNNNISQATGTQWDHEQLLRTASGRWVINFYSQYRERAETYRFVTDTEAREWLLTQKCDEAVVKYFGEIEDEKGPGRPEVGPAASIRLGDELTAKIDAVRQDGESRAAAIRRVLTEALA